MGKIKPLWFRFNVPIFRSTLLKAFTARMQSVKVDFRPGLHQQRLQQILFFQERGRSIATKKQ